MDVFALRNQLVEDYSAYVRSFIRIRDERIDAFVREKLSSGLLWPDALIQLNPAFEPGEWVDELADAGVLHPTCKPVFRAGKTPEAPAGRPFRLHRHQADAVRAAKTGENYVLTTGTGSGK